MTDTDALWEALRAALDAIGPDISWRSVSASWEHPTKGGVSITITAGDPTDDVDDVEG